jgi:ubiquinone/menaquinone biosynthesis C-methylase UbiE
VVRAHASRTAENSAAFVIPHLTPGVSVLDVGCGPGSITCDFAGLVAPGKVTGLDRSPDVITHAQELASDRGVENVEFVAGNIYDLDFEDDTFDVVHAHQVLQHLTDPVEALREMRRVAKPGGIVAVRVDIFWLLRTHRETLLLRARDRPEQDRQFFVVGRLFPCFCRARFCG